MEKPIKVVSYNCRGFPKTASKLGEKPSLNLLLNDKSNDIICLQETFLSKQDLSCLNSIHKDYQGIGVSTTDGSVKLITGHPPGGVAILYRVNQSRCIKPMFFNLDWVIGVCINNGNTKHVILCVYMKTASGGQDDHREIFQGQLEELESIIAELDTTSVNIVGDWNADLINPSHLHGPLLRQFSNETSLIISSERMLPENTFTFVSEMRLGETSWLDHCVSTQDGHNIILNMKVGYHLAFRDHLPVFMELDLCKLPEVEEEINNVMPKINWEKYDSIKLREYSLMSDIYLRSISIPREALDCRDTKCKNVAHIHQLKKFYDSICKCLTDASRDTFEIRERKPYNCRPGFNEHVKELHDIARKRFVAWREANRPRNPDNPFFKEMTSSRARFKLALRYIKRHENQLRQDAIANALCNEGDGSFWKEIRKIGTNNVPLPTSIESATGKKEIVELWRNHFESLMNCVNGKSSDELEYKCEYSPNMVIIPSQIEDAINKLVEGKSCGLDGIYAEHLKHCSVSYRPLIAECMTSMLVHGYLPDNLMSVVLVPIIKDKSGKINSIDNYRPIAIASVMSKVLEILLLERLSDYLLTSSNQFGFKAKHSTDTCIYVLKEAVDHYVGQQSSVYLCFLDASKAFDRVTHYTLFNKLIKRGVPGYLVRILIYWYTKQGMSVRWGSAMSNSFNVSNGVRQGGILSPYLFCIYMDDLSSRLNGIYAGCKIGARILNHLFYADDLVLMCPSHAGLQDLLNTCEEYAVEHDIKFNTKKSVVLIRRNRLLKNSIVPKFKLCGEELIEVEEAKYLGHYITADGKDTSDMTKACRQLYAQGNSLIRKFHMCTESAKIKLFVTYCSQIYCAQLWQYSSSDKAYSKLNVAYNNIFRFFLGLPRDAEGRVCSASMMFVTRKVKSFQEIMRNLVYRFKCRVLSADNEIVRCTLFPNVSQKSKQLKHWNRVLLSRAI